MEVYVDDICCFFYGSISQHHHVAHRPDQVLDYRRVFEEAGEPGRMKERIGFRTECMREGGRYQFGEISSRVLAMCATGKTGSRERRF